MAKAKAPAALCEVTAAMKNSTLKVPLQLGEIGLIDEQEDLEEEMRTGIANAAAIAEGPAGDH